MDLLKFKFEVVTLNLVTVNSAKCIKCGRCADVCARRIITMEFEGPVGGEASDCMACGQCVAVCPNAALDNWKSPLDQQVAVNSQLSIGPQEATQFLRSRRSIRCYKPQSVEQNKLEQLLDITRFAPTGGNTQGVSYLVISDREKLKDISLAAITWMAQQLANGNAMAKPYARSVHHFQKTGRSVILRDAPHLIVAMAPEALARGKDNAQYSLTYAELYAPTLGLGTCWAGFLQRCAFCKCEPLLQLLDLPIGMVFAGALMVGYPKYSYPRLVDRNPLQVIWR